MISEKFSQMGSLDNFPRTTLVHLRLVYPGSFPWWNCYLMYPVARKLRKELCFRTGNKGAELGSVTGSFEACSSMRARI